MENSPPHTKGAPPQTSELAKFLKKNRPEFWRRPFFFPKFGRKKRLNFGFRPKNHSEFWRRPFFFFFFFWRSPNFGPKKRLNFGFRPKNHSEFWRRPFFFFFGDHLILGRKNV